MFTRTSDMNAPFQALGDLLNAEGLEFAIVVVGGAALNLLGLVERATRDVDVLAFKDPPDTGRAGGLTLARQLPPRLAQLARRVARDFGLEAGWLNCAVAEHSGIEFPEGMEERLHWRHFGGLAIGLADRRDLICFKLHAAVDRDPGSVHYQDLLALRPSDEELQRAADWAREQDPSVGFADVLGEALEHVKRNAR
jgi:Nucleotidyltransferase of unknown function (DUF6036)